MLSMEVPDENKHQKSSGGFNLNKFRVEVQNRVATARVHFADYSLPANRAIDPLFPPLLP